MIPQRSTATSIPEKPSSTSSLIKTSTQEDSTTSRRSQRLLLTQ